MQKMKLELNEKPNNQTSKIYLLRKGAKTKLTYTCKTNPNWHFFTYTKFEISNTKRIKKAARTSLVERLSREYEKTQAYKDMRHSVYEEAQGGHVREPWVIYRQKTREYINSILPNYECDAEPVKQEEKQ